MVARRHNDPVGLTDDPVCVTDPARQAELIAEFQCRLNYLKQNYRMGKVVYGDARTSNDAIRALNALKAGEPPRSGDYRRLPPMIEIAVSMNARRFAVERTGRPEAPVEGQDIRRAAELIGMRIRPIGHRPRADNLIHHVRGLMALIQDFSGRPVVPRRYRNNLYEPHFAQGASQLVPMVFRELEPSVSVGGLVTIAERARRSWGGRRRTFGEYFPAYGLRLGPDGSLVSPSGQIVVRIEPNIPTYFH
jgi:hypothetical protein